MTTTPFSDRGSRSDAWNMLPVDTEIKAWPFMILANQIVAGAGRQQRAAIELLRRRRHGLAADRRRRTSSGLRATAEPQVTTGRLPRPEKAELTISGVDQVGNYQVYSAGEPGEPPRLQRQSSRALDGPRPAERKGGNATFRPLSPQIARSNEQIVRNSGRSPRRPRDIFLVDCHVGGTAGNGVYRKQLVL